MPLMRLRPLGVMDVNLGGGGDLLHKVGTKEFKRIASAKSRSAWGTSHQPALMGSCLTVHVDVFSVDVFLNGDYGFIYMGN